MANLVDISLLNQAIESFNSASATLTQYYRNLEEKVGRLTEEVEHKKQLLDSILDSIDVGVIFFDGGGVIRLVNSAAERLLTIRAEKIIGGDSFRASLNGEVIVPENGKPFYALVSRSDVCDREGNSIGHVVLFKDVTRLKQLEAENERNRRLTAMGELVLKIAHEIRNPLGSIELFASLLAGDLKGTEHGEYASRISNSVRYLVNSLDNMLRFSKEIKPASQVCCINEIIGEICREFGELFPEERIQFHLSEEGRYWLPVDRGLIRQAMINIILNSVQAIPDRGEIRVRIYAPGDQENPLEGKRGGADGKPAFVALSIKDNGIGMDEETQTRIFEPFFSTKDRGTGLGMSITSGIISAHRGTIAVRSSAGKGTEFTIRLPAKG
ncbi:MAG: PAS domain-containing protein [Alphaproteobacteria bacterium]|uniref:histidine kinase n=1 Tax=Candidatus Nitrobium versatile TaxID=2884831 RepID=A0A953J4T1_9BACT|nr:PAS domain-containing protein [Candidatus Nitrobium versatile]